MDFTHDFPIKINIKCFFTTTTPASRSPVLQSDHSFSSSSESSSDSLYSTAMRRDRIVATSLPTGSLFASCSLCSCTFLSWIPGDGMGRVEDEREMEGGSRAVTGNSGVRGNSSAVKRHLSSTFGADYQLLICSSYKSETDVICILV